MKSSSDRKPMSQITLDFDGKAYKTAAENCPVVITGRDCLLRGAVAGKLANVCLEMKSFAGINVVGEIDENVLCCIVSEASAFDLKVVVDARGCGVDRNVILALGCNIIDEGKVTRPVRPARSRAMLTSLPEHSGGNKVPADAFVSGAFHQGMPASLAGDALSTLPIDLNTVTVGRTGAGKTYGWLLPTALTCAHSSDKPSMVVIDAKNTCYEELAPRLREEGYDVWCIDLRTGKGDCYDPLHEAFYTHRAGNPVKASQLAATVIDCLAESVSGNHDKYWETATKEIATSIFSIMLARADFPCGVVDLAKIATSGRDKLLRIADLAELAAPKAAARLKVNLPEAKNTWSCLESSLAGMFGFYLGNLGEEVCGGNKGRIVSLSDFAPDAPKPMALFVICPDEYVEGNAYAAALLQSIYASRISSFEAGFEGVPRDLHVFVDEAARFPKSVFSKLTATGRSRRFFLHIALQSSSQLEEAGYTPVEAKVIVENSQALIVLASTDRNVADELSLRSGGLDVFRHMLPLLDKGEAFVSYPGLPVLTAKMPSFADVAESLEPAMSRAA